MSTGGQSPSLDDIMQRRRAGETRPVRVRFRSVDPFDLWIWVELYSAPPPAALGMLREVVDAWYLMGRLGAYDAGAMIVWQASQYDVSNLEYDRERDDGPVAATPAAMHSMADLETQGPWVRFWVDLGSADELALDLLINALRGLSVDHLGIKSIVVGGVNDDWPVPEKAFPELTMSPMRTSMPDIDPGSGFNPYDSDDLEESLRRGFWDRQDGDG